MIVIEGFSGSGKSTQVRLLTPLYPEHEYKVWFMSTLIMKGKLDEEDINEFFESNPVPDYMFYLYCPMAIAKLRRYERDIAKIRAGIRKHYPLKESDSEMTENCVNNVKTLQKYMPNLYIINGVQCAQNVHKEIVSIMEDTTKCQKNR